jgi:hypothetical protein
MIFEYFSDTDDIFTIFSSLTSCCNVSFAYLMCVLNNQSRDRLMEEEEDHQRPIESIDRSGRVIQKFLVLRGPRLSHEQFKKPLD